MSALHPQLADFRRQIDEATARAVRIGESVDDARFGRRPREGAWSAAECLAHLSLTTKAYLPLLDAALAEGAPTGAAASRRFKPDVKGRLLAWMLEPPFRVKVKTTTPFVPASDRPKREVVEEFVALQGELAGRVARADGHDLERLRITSPFSEKVRYNLYSAFACVLAHERRHLWQAERAVE